MYTPRTEKATLLQDTVEDSESNCPDWVLCSLLRTGKIFSLVLQSCQIVAAVKSNQRISIDMNLQDICTLDQQDKTLAVTALSTALRMKTKHLLKHSLNKFGELKQPQLLLAVD